MGRSELTQEDEERKRKEEKARTLMFYHNLTPGSCAKSLEKDQLTLEVNLIKEILGDCLIKEGLRATTRVEQLQVDGSA